MQVVLGSLGEHHRRLTASLDGVLGDLRIFLPEEVRLRRGPSHSLRVAHCVVSRGDPGVLFHFILLVIFKSLYACLIMYGSIERC